MRKDLLIEKYKDLAHEIWAAAQLVPGEGIENGAARIAEILKKEDNIQSIMIGEMAKEIASSQLCPKWPVGMHYPCEDIEGACPITLTECVVEYYKGLAQKEEVK